MLINSTLINHTDDLVYYADQFPLPYEDDEILNRTYYDDYLFESSVNQTTDFANSDLFSFSSIFTFSSPFSYIVVIIIIYSALTIVLLTFSLYKQRQTEIENFYLGDTEEDVQQSKRYLIWKQFLIGKITKGDMQPLLIETSSHVLTDQMDCPQSKTATFPLRIV